MNDSAVLTRPARRSPRASKAPEAAPEAAVVAEAGHAAAPARPDAKGAEAKGAPAIAPARVETAEFAGAPPKPGAADSPAGEPAVVKSRTQQDDRTGRYLISGTLLAIAVSYLIVRRGWYTPDDDVGYYLGLVGGVMMLLLLTYPLRKYLQAFRTWGPVRHWFSFHMFLGVAGPVLVIAHSTFTLKSTNATVAFICMLLVASSGIIGRFIYVRIHRGLHGEKLNFKELQSKAGFESEEMHSKLHFVPGVERRLTDFQGYALAENLGFARSALRLITLGTRRRIAYARCAGDLKRAMREIAENRQWDRDKLRRRLGRALHLVDDFLVSVQRVSQFNLYDRMFRLWHVAHVPLVYLLVLSGIAHVVAVHMY